MVDASFQKQNYVNLVFNQTTGIKSVAIARKVIFIVHISTALARTSILEAKVDNAQYFVVSSTYMFELNVEKDISF